MKITSFNPLIITKDPESAIQLFEELGFERHHTKTGISESKRTNVRMEDANDFHVDIAGSDDEWSLIRMNVDDVDEAIAILEKHGFRRPKRESVSDTVDTGSSKLAMMVSPSGFIIAVSEHIKNHD